MPCFKMARASCTVHLKTNATIPFQKQVHDKNAASIGNMKIKKK